MGSRAGLNVLKKRRVSVLARDQTLIVKLVAIHYAD
jgi:hypothetical protein